MGAEKMNQIISPASAKTIIAVDVSKDRLDVHAHPVGKSASFSNDSKGFAQLISWAKPLLAELIVFEATGAYHRSLERALGKAGINCAKLNPWQARRFAEASGKRVKTGQVDAALLAKFGAIMQPTITAKTSEPFESLKELLAARRALIKDRTAATNRSKNITLPLLKRQAAQHLRQIEGQIEAIDLACQDLLKQDEKLAQTLRILSSIPGIGTVAALAMLVDMPELGSLDAKQAASLAGLVRWQDWFVGRTGTDHPPIRQVAGKKPHWRRQSVVA
jgi:transposase